MEPLSRKQPSRLTVPQPFLVPHPLAAQGQYRTRHTPVIDSAEKT